MPRQRREFKRLSFSRNVQRLFVIATEGVKTEIKYFEQFKSLEYNDNQSIFIEVLKRSNTDSSPTKVINQLNRFSKEFNLRGSIQSPSVMNYLKIAEEGIGVELKPNYLISAAPIISQT